MVDGSKRCGRKFWQALCLRLFALGWLLAVSPAAAQPEQLCVTPRAAMQQFLDNLQADQFRPEEAVRCFERPAEMDEATLVQRARELKAVLDHRGMYVVMEDVPDDADYRDASGRQRAIPVDGFEVLQLRKQSGKWRVPASLVDQIPRLYRDTFSSVVEGILAELPPALRRSFLGVEAWQGLALVLLLGLAWVLSRLIMVIFRNRIGALFKRWGVETDVSALTVMARPLGLVAAVGLISWVLPELRLPIGLSRGLSVAVKLAVALATVMVAYRLVDVVMARFASRAAQTATKMDDQVVVLVRKALRALVVSIGIIVVLQNLSVNVSGLLAGLGIGGLALALAAKDTAANLFGSITIFIDAPFYVGDWIAAAGVEGTVLEIGLRSTRLRTAYDSVVTVPNSKLADSNIDNYARRTARRYRTTLTIGYGATVAQIEAFVEGVRAIIANHPQARKENYDVHFTGFGDSALEIIVNVFFEVGGWSAEQAAKHRLLIAIKRLAAELGVEFAFPTQTLHIESQVEARPFAPATVPANEALAATVVAYGPGGERAEARGAPLTHGYFAGDLSPLAPTKDPKA